jgi:hypothetical protein
MNRTKLANRIASTLIVTLTFGLPLVVVGVTPVSLVVAVVVAAYMLS